MQLSRRLLLRFVREMNGRTQIWFVWSSTARIGRYTLAAPPFWSREGGTPPSLRHVGLYAYRVGALKQLALTPSCELERIECLEQLRALWLGMKIIVAEACEVPPRGVDTAEDLDAVRLQCNSV